MAQPSRLTLTAWPVAGIAAWPPATVVFQSAVVGAVVVGVHDAGGDFPRRQNLRVGAGVVEVFGGVERRRRGQRAADRDDRRVATGRSEQCEDRGQDGAREHKRRRATDREYDTIDHGLGIGSSVDCLMVGAVIRRIADARSPSGGARSSPID